MGGEDDEAVLITSTESFKLTKVETSNTVMLVPDLYTAAEACSNCDAKPRCVQSQT